jgi:ferrous iron transport protein B
MSGRIGRLLEPLIAPLGFDWRIGTAMVGATAAKEVFVAQMGVVFSVGEADEESDFLRAKLRDRYTQLVGFCIMLFALISTPCVATFAVTRQETGSVKWALAQYFGLTAVAWVVTFVVYQAGSLLGWGVT